MANSTHFAKCTVTYNSKFMVTEIFNSNAGVRQGCILSPVLFISYIDELVNDTENSEYVEFLLMKS